MITTVGKNDAIWSFYSDYPCNCVECNAELDQDDYKGWVWKSLTDKQYLYCPSVNKHDMKTGRLIMTCYESKTKTTECPECGRDLSGVPIYFFKHEVSQNALALLSECNEEDVIWLDQAIKYAPCSLRDFLGVFFLRGKKICYTENKK